MSGQADIITRVDSEADGERQMVRVLCVLHQRQVHVAGLLLSHVHPSASGQCDSHRFIIRTDRYVNRDEAYATAAGLTGRASSP